MCNLYLMYYTPYQNDDFKVCSGMQTDNAITKMLPADSDRLLFNGMKEQIIPYDNGHPDQPTSNKDKKQFPFGGKCSLIRTYNTNNT